MTVAEYYHDKPFAMLNWHRNWCKKQRMPGFCFYEISDVDVKSRWDECPNCQMCFTAFINSDISKEKGANDECKG